MAGKCAVFWPERFVHPAPEYNVAASLNNKTWRRMYSRYVRLPACDWR